MRNQSVRRLLVSSTFLGLVSAACADSAPRARADSAAGSARTAPQTTAAVPAPQTVEASVGSAHDSSHVKQNARVTRPVGKSTSGETTRRIVFGYVDFTGVGHDRGKPSAPVVVIELSDYACPYCGEFARNVYPEIDREYVQTGKVLFKYIPFIAGSFPHSAEATRAAECAGEQGQFWPMLDHLYAAQAEWKGSHSADEELATMAGTLSIDRVKYAACYADRHTDAHTAQATAIAVDLGVRVTPSFLVDGHPVQGALPFAEFRKQIETALLLKSANGAWKGEKGP